MAERPDAVLIAGPTASGKSALALEVARRHGGVIVNADSMQVYDALAVLTARPGREEMAGTEHLLYGHVPAATAYSVAGWLKDAASALAGIRASGRVAIFVGGTGLYLKALEEGLSPIPDPDPAIRAAWRSVSLSDPGRLHGELMARDSAAAAMLEPGDTQRLVRALEVHDSTGRSILEWQREGRGDALLRGLRVDKWLIEPERGELHRRIDERFDRMLAAGALDEVRALLSHGLATSLPVMRAIGVPQLGGHLRGETDLDTATARAKAASRQYAKRQSTWFRHQMAADWRVRKT